MSSIFMFILNAIEPRPIKFENFDSAEEAQSYLIEKYPIGTEFSEILKDLTSSGAKCMQRSEKIIESFEYEKIYVCTYSNNFFSFSPFDLFYTLIYLDNNEKIVDIFVKQKSKLGLT